MSNLDRALRYADDGLSVIPLKLDKRPLIDWKEFQTRCATEDEIRNWWQMFPDALVGIATGKISGISVVDVEKGGDPSMFPATFTVQTGNGGIHLWYDYAEIGNMTRVFPLVDVRGDGGYIVAPPSVTKYEKDGKPAGGEYLVLDDAPKMPFPIALFQKAHQGKFDIKTLKGVESGSRNTSAASVIGFLLSKTPKNECHLAWSLTKAWNQQNKPPLGEFELKSVFESILKREATKPKEEEEITIVPLKEAAEQPKEVSPRNSTGFPFLDEASKGGIGAGELWTISAPQGQGKTTLAMEITLKLAQQGIKSLWLSYEFLEEELWEKFKTMGAPDEFATYTTLRRAKGDINIIEKVVQKAVAQEDVKVVFIDHFGRLSGKIDKYDSGMSSNFAVYLAIIAERLKQLSLDQRVGVVLMAHTKKPEKGRKQTTSDIANTSGLGNEASMSLILEREVDDFAPDQDADKYTSKLFVKVDKARWGRETVKLMKFENGRITDWDKVEDLVIKKSW